MTTEEIIRQLVEETNALPRQELPGAFTWAKDHPGIMTHRTKSQQRYDQDMRRAHFIEEAQKRAPDYFRSSPELLRESTSDQLGAMKSAYQPYGPDGPLSTTGRWMGSLPGAVYATGQMLANKMDPAVTPYPNAADDYAKNMNNLLVFAEPFGKNKNHLRDMQDMRTAQDSVRWNNFGAPREFVDQFYEHQYGDRAAPKGGREYLADAGMTGAGASVLGAVMDATLDPLMTPANTWGGLALDYGLGTAHETLPLAAQAVEAIRRLRESQAYGR